MRLTPQERSAIRAASLRHFGVAPRLFGSRVDDSRRGGDIDLYIEAELTPQEAFRREMRMAAELFAVIGEQKIDIVVNTGGHPLPIHEVAQRDGVWL